MQILTPEDQQSLQNELTVYESLLWSGKPSTNVVFHSSDWSLVPFSLMWGGFAIFWEAGASGFFGFGNNDRSASPFFMLWGIPFVLIGQYMIWGRFLYAAWRKRRIVYAVTSRRVIVIAQPPKPKVISTFIENIPVFDKEIRADGIGTLKFGHVNEFVNGRSRTSGVDSLFLNSGVPVFADIEDAQNVVTIINHQRERANRQTRPE